MKIIEDGNFVRWIRVSLFLIGLIVGYIGFAINNAPNFLRLFLILVGFAFIAIGGYASQANTLKIKPFDNGYKKAKASYSKPDEENKTEEPPK